MANYPSIKNTTVVRPSAAALAALALGANLYGPIPEDVGLFQASMASAVPSSCVLYSQGTSNLISAERETANVITVDARQRQLAVDAISTIAKLPENWNRNGAPAIPQDIVDRARRVLARLTRIPAITPTAMPGIQMDYEDEDAGYVEFEFLGNGNVEMFFEDALQTRDFERVITDEEVPDVVRRFHDQTL